MTDYFSILDQPRRPWLDPEVLKKQFLALSTAVHPDRVHNASDGEKQAAQHRYAELNLAYNQLRQPKERLQHLLELETGAKPRQVQQVPAELTEFFFQIGQLLRQTDAFLTNKAATPSPLLQVQLFETGQSWTEKLTELQRQVHARQGWLLENLRRLDEEWVRNASTQQQDRCGMLRRLEDLYRLFSYFARWESQIQERIVQLSF